MVPFDNNVAVCPARAITGEALIDHDNSKVLNIIISLKYFDTGDPNNLPEDPPKIYIFPISSITEFVSLRLSGGIPLTLGTFHFKEFKLNE
jgi:hypothetical protein